MKLLIDDTLTFFGKDDPSSTEQDHQDSEEEWAEMTALCDKFGVKYHHEHSDGNTVFTVPPQKIVLDEYDMNELLYDVFFLLEYDMQYAWIGGKGCEVALTITPKRD